MLVPVDIEQIDPRNEPALKAWWEVGRAATAERPGSPWPAWEQSRVALPAHDPERELVLLAAIDGRTMAAAGMVILPRADNRHLGGVAVWVHPDRRREGIGSSLLVELEAVASGHGRTTLTAEGYVPPGGSGPAEAFARARGYDVASRESIKELRVSDHLARRDALRDTVAAAVADYRVVTFDTVCPDEHLASFARLMSRLLDEIPLGELDVVSSEWTPERLRAAEQRQVAIGRHLLTALAIAPDGSVAGSSDVRVNDAEPEHGQVGVTIVDPAHRGHRLGLALKLAALDLALAAYPVLETVETSNAEVNAHMNAVNDQLGYRSIETLLELQKRL